MKKLARIASGALGLLALSACEPSEEKKAQLAEQRRIECMDKFCEGDVPPKFDKTKEVVLKLNNQWFIGPNQYFTPSRNGAVFYWPSKTPMTGPLDGGRYPEKYQEFSEVAIEIFFRSNRIPPEPRGYKLIQMAESNGWIESRKFIRPGLEAITMKHVFGPDNQYFDHVTYYIATDLKGRDGLPPVASCAHEHAYGGGGTGFMWQPDIWVGTRMNQKHCVDWPEIYQELDRVIQQLRKG